MVVPIYNTIPVHAKKEELSTWKQDVLFSSCSVSESEFSNQISVTFFVKKKFGSKKTSFNFSVGWSDLLRPPS